MAIAPCVAGFSVAVIFPCDAAEALWLGILGRKCGGKKPLDFGAGPPVMMLDAGACWVPKWPFST